MNLFELFVKIGVDDSEFNKGVGKAKKGFGNFSTWTVAKGQLIADSIKAGGKALIDFGKQAINSYAEYEQLVGGVETLFKKSSDTVMKYAAFAFRTSGMSANEYMSTVTGFSASLLQGLGGDTQKAAEIANLAVTDMADNSNKMGTSMEMIQNALTFRAA
jgi:hypothetical protein